MVAHRTILVTAPNSEREGNYSPPDKDFFITQIHFFMMEEKSIILFHFFFVFVSVLFETVSEGLTTSESVTIPSLRENNTIKSLVVELQQKDPSHLTVEVHVNCDSVGQVDFPTTPRKMMEGAGEGEPKIHIVSVFRDSLF